MILNNKFQLSEELNKQKNLQVTFTASLDPDSIIANDIAKVLHSDWFYQNLVSDADYYYFVLYDDSEAVSVLSYFLDSEFKLARLDDVVTLPDKRNNGYSTFLLAFANKWVQNNGYTPYLFVTNEIAKNIYTKVGFEEVFTCQRVHWIKELEK